MNAQSKRVNLDEDLDYNREEIHHGVIEGLGIKRDTAPLRAVKIDKHSIQYRFEDDR